MSARITRINLNVNDECAAFLVAKREAGTSMTETIRRAIALLKFIEDETLKGNVVQIVDKRGKAREVVFVQ